MQFWYVVWSVFACMELKGWIKWLNACTYSYIHALSRYISLLRQVLSQSAFSLMVVKGYWRWEPSQNPLTLIVGSFRFGHVVSFCLSRCHDGLSVLEDWHYCSEILRVIWTIRELSQLSIERLKNSVNKCGAPLSLALQLEGISTVTGMDIEACALASSLESQDEACQGEVCFRGRGAGLFS